MARYYGDFRSLDTSNDPKGQKYRVLIFTKYNGASPYEYRYAILPTETTAGVQVPVVGTSLTMAERPFVVTYEGDESNIYKPYRCSTAEASFMQSSINLDFLNSNGTSTLVVLLKWKNEVSEVSGRMYNSITGETLNKRRISRVSSLGEEVFFNDYEPYKYDKFCYNVDWIGFSTPETYSMEFDHTRDVFTLNAQDAFSVLQYKETDLNRHRNTLCNALDIVLGHVGMLGTYKKVYVTDTIRFSGISDNAILATIAQSKNFFDEDGKPVSQFETVTRLLAYLGMTAIPYKDKLIITTPNAIAEGWSTYNVYALPSTAYIMNWGGDTYTRQPDEQISDSHAVTIDSFAGGGTRISTCNVFNSATAVVNEYPVECIIPEMGDDNSFERERLYRQNFISAWGRQYSWERKVCIPVEDTFTLYQYPVDGWYQHGMYHDITWQSTPLETYDYNLTRNPSCFIIDDGGVLETDNGEMPLNVSFSRKIIFNTMSSGAGVSTRGTDSGSQDFDDKTQFSQTFLEVQSDNLLLNAGKWLNIVGDWAFYVNIVNPNPSTVDTPMSANNTSYAPAQAQYGYIWAEVRCGNKWLYSPSVSEYTWVDNECFCKLWLEVSDGDAAWGNVFSFKQNKRNIDGIMVRLPNVTGIVEGSVSVRIERPLGVSSVICHCATLKGFGVYVRESDDPDYWIDGNTEYKTTIREGAISDYDNIDLFASSVQKQGTTYSQVVKSENTAIVEMPSVYNVATGAYALAEQQITQNIARQYGTPIISLAMTLHSPITPYTLLTWAQLPDIKFVVVGAETDFERETVDVTVCEVKRQQPSQLTARRNATRNYRRNGDLVIDSKKYNRGTETLALGSASTTTTRTISGHTITTDNELEGLLTVEPQFGENRLLVSVPDGVAMTPSVDANGHLIFNFE